MRDYGGEKKLRNQNMKIWLTYYEYEYESTSASEYECFSYYERRRKFIFIAQLRNMKDFGSSISIRYEFVTLAYAGKETLPACHYT